MVYSTARVCRMLRGQTAAGVVESTIYSAVMDEETVRATVRRLARPHRSGGVVIERAAILAVGDGSADLLAWIDANGEAEELTAVRARPRGLHSARLQDDGGHAGLPQRYVLPPDALS